MIKIEPFSSNPDWINMAAFCSDTTVLGPGHRSVVWVQGCPFKCKGCLAPEWLSMKTNQITSVSYLAEKISTNSIITGITFSGGEPMLQARPLARLIHLVRQIRSVNLICFTGFTLDQLEKLSPTTGVFDLLNEIDVLIDGQYIEAENDGIGLRGSANQKIHYFTDQLKNFNLNRYPRRSEIHLTQSDALVVGVPPFGLLSEMDLVINRVRGKKLLEVRR